MSSVRSGFPLETEILQFYFSNFSFIDIDLANFWYKQIEKNVLRPMINMNKLSFLKVSIDLS